MSTPTNSSDVTSGTDNSWIIGALLCVVAALFSNAGLNTQKLAIDRSKAGVVKWVKVMWALGLGGIALGSICDFVALAYAPQSIVAPLGALTLPTNVVLAPIMHGEKLITSDMIWTMVIVTGCVVSVMYASHTDSEYTEDQLFSFFWEGRFAAYALTVVFTIVSWLVIIRHIERIQNRFGTNSPQYIKWFKVHRFSYAAVSGITGAQSILFAKAWMLLIKNHGFEFFTFWRFYILAFGLATSASLQIYWLNCGLARWEALYNVPIFQSFWIIVSVLGGGIVYHEFSEFTDTQAIMFPLGILLTVVGVFMLSQKDATIEAGHDRRMQKLGGEYESDAALLSEDEDSDSLNADEVDNPFFFANTTSTRRRFSSTSNIDSSRTTRFTEDFHDFGVFFQDASILGLGVNLITTDVNHWKFRHMKELKQLWQVKNITPNGAAAIASPRIEVGDVIISVNGDSLLDESTTPKRALEVLKEKGQSLELVLRRYKYGIQDQSISRAMGMTPAAIYASTGSIFSEVDLNDDDRSHGLLEHEIGPSSSLINQQSNSSVSRRRSSSLNSARDSVTARRGSFKYAVERSHQSLRYATMDPLMGILHKGGNLYTPARANKEIPGSRAEAHPLASAVESVNTLLHPVTKKIDTALDLITGDSRKKKVYNSQLSVDREQQRVEDRNAEESPLQKSRAESFLEKGGDYNVNSADDDSFEFPQTVANENDHEIDLI